MRIELTIPRFHACIVMGISLALRTDRFRRLSTPEQINGSERRHSTKECWPVLNFGVGKTSVSLDEHFLNDIFTIVCVTQNSPRGPVDHRTMFIDNF